MSRPPKPWEKVGPASASSSGPVGDRQTGGAVGSSVAQQSTTRPPARPWERPAGAAGVIPGGAGAGPYSSSTGAYQRPAAFGGQGIYGSAYGTGRGMYGQTGMYGTGSAYGSSYGGYGAYGEGYGGYGTYSGGYGAGGLYGGSPYGGGMYGRYGGGYGGVLGSGPGTYGGGMYGGQIGMGMPPPPLGGPHDGSPTGPPTAWHGMLESIHRIVNFFGRLSFLVDENAQAMHFFISALLQLLDRFGSLYGELARFVLRLLGYNYPKEQPRLAATGQPPALPPGAEHPGEQAAVRPPLAAAWGAEMASNTAPDQGQAWDNMWSRGS